jgi:hypothetical protein
MYASLGAAFKRRFGLAEVVEWENICRKVVGWHTSNDEDKLS